ncbi:glycosyltransferase family 4 protein (plasmid) [Sinorhizobium meliloti WSM1022]|uniref:glycosyltransferase family 4 protein n=1 Tax=Rhizobium meliloti TaxID=382 RepID=UPI0003FE52C4|nr:glycosyltransferase family 4 protein [Sinorhizobium meliloti]QKN17589.1 glycosyltransferase family 4 protein [Sinorhizobium meliloti WSM1022]
MKLVYVGQPYDRLFPPVQNSIGLIVYNTALHLSNSLHITVYGRHYRDDRVPADLPFALRRAPVRRDRLLQKVIREFPRPARWTQLDRKADDHSQYRNEIRRYLALDRPDVVHLMNYWKWSRALKPPGSSHRLVLEMQCEWLSQRDRDQVASQLEVVDAVVAVSDHIAETFRSAFPDYPGAVASVGNGVDVFHFRPSEAGASGDARTGRVILFVGRISPEKGLHTLVEAFSEVALRFPDVGLRIAGPYSPLPVDFLTSLSSDPRVLDLKRFYDQWNRCRYQQHLDELMDRHRLRHRIRFLGNVSHKELVAAYHDADIVVNPSLSESFGISVVEGMACGIPVVGTRVGGMCESILDGHTGMLVEADAPGELSQALITVLDDPARARGMGTEGRERAVALYSWEARAERLRSVYERVSR